jgi:hypothetical protein
MEIERIESYLYRPFLGIHATVKYGSGTTCKTPGFSKENPNPCTIAIVPGSVAITYKISHKY